MFDLEQFAHKIVEQSHEPSPNELAYIAFGKLHGTPDADDALLQSLRVYFRNVLVDSRKYQPEPQQQQSTPKRAPRTGSPPTPFMDRVRSEHQRKLDTPYQGVATDEYPSGWKPLREFRIEDCVHAANQRWQIAKNNQRVGDLFDQFSKKLENSGVKSLGDFEESSIGELLDEI